VNIMGTILKGLVKIVQRKPHVVFHAKVALLAVGVAIVICVALFSAPAQTGYEASNVLGAGGGGEES
jgi:hypothetical protein